MIFRRSGNRRRADSVLKRFFFVAIKKCLNGILGMPKKINKKNLAQKYAEALFADAKTEDCVDSVHSELRDLVRLSAECSEFAELLKTPLLNEKIRSDAVEAVADKLGLSTLAHNFLGVLAQNGRLSLLDEIESAFDRLYDDDKGILNVRVTTAVPMDDAQTRRLTDVLASVYDKQIRLNPTVDENLIGGLTVQVGTVMADLSVKTQLQKINLAMKGVGV